MINKNKKLIILILMVMTVMVKTEDTTKKKRQKSTEVCELNTSCRNRTTNEPITLSVSGRRGRPGLDGPRGEPGVDGIAGLPGAGVPITLIAFFVMITEERKRLKRNSDVILDKVNFNEGSGYSAETGRFTVPRNGVYQFKFTLQEKGRSRGGRGVIQLHKISIWTGEQKLILATIADPRPTGNTAILECVEGDEVWLVLLGGDEYTLHGPTETTFSGLLIFP